MTLLRRTFAALGLMALTAVSACERAASKPAAGKVVLYSSLDSEILTPIIERFERESGLDVDVLGDTEATKTTGLATRLLSERDRPRADVWWSSECLASVRLAREGVIDGWTPVAARPRVIIVNSDRVKMDERPRTLAALAQPRFAGRIGLAKAQFGTMRAHLAAILATAGQEPTTAWLASLKNTRARLYDGNSSVARAVATGEVWVGIVDIDDALSAQGNSWPVQIVTGLPVEHGAPLIDGGTLLIPGSAGLVKGGPHAEAAAKLFAYITSAAVEEQLVTGPQRWTPITPQGRERWPAQVPHGSMEVDWSKAEAAAERAAQLWESAGL